MKLKTPRPSKSVIPDRSQSRQSKLRLGPLTPEQAIAGIFKLSLEDVQRIREEEEKLKTRNKTK
jgi:hypothetical protein